jgi:hypothetical protein
MSLQKESGLAARFREEVDRYAGAEFVLAGYRSSIETWKPR